MMAWPDAVMIDLSRNCTPQGTKCIGQIAFWLAYQAHARHSLETGIGGGYVAMLLARAAQLTGGIHVSVDIDPNACDRARHALMTFGLRERCDIICADALDLDPDMFALGLDVLFLDSDHSERQVRAEWAKFSPLLVPGGTAILHDTTKEPGPAALVADLRRDPAWTVISWPEGPGWSMVRHVDKENA